MPLVQRLTVTKIWSKRVSKVPDLRTAQIRTGAWLPPPAPPCRHGFQKTSLTAVAKAIHLWLLIICIHCVPASFPGCTTETSAEGIGFMSDTGMALNRIARLVCQKALCRALWATEVHVSDRSPHFSLKQLKITTWFRQREPAES